MDFGETLRYYDLLTTIVIGMIRTPHFNVNCTDIEHFTINTQTGPDPQ